MENDNDAPVVKYVSASDTKERLRVSEQNIRALETRIVRLEEEMALCLKWMRMQAEAEIKRRNLATFTTVPGGAKA